MVGVLVTLGRKKTIRNRETEKKVPYCDFCNNDYFFNTKGKTIFCGDCGRFASRVRESDVEALKASHRERFFKKEGDA